MSFPFKPILLFVFLLILLFIVKSNVLDAPYHWDVMGYIMPTAHALFDTGQFSSMTGLSGHPPLFFIILALSWKMFGQSVLVSHTLILIFGAASLTLLFVLTEKLYSWKEAATAVLLLFFNQLFFAQVGMVYLSVPLMCLAVLTVHLYTRQRQLFYLISATALILIKETAVIVIAAIVLFDLAQGIFHKVKAKVLFKRIIVLALPLVSLLLWVFYHWNLSGWMVNMNLLVNKDRALRIFRGNLFRHLIFDGSPENVNKANWIIFSALVIFIISQVVKKKRLKFEWLFLTIIILNILFFSYADDLPRYFLICYPFYFILGARAFVTLSEMLRKKYLVFVVLISAMVFLSILNYSGRRSTDGWRLESNMEYLDLVRISQSTARFIESNFPEHNIITTFPLSFAFTFPSYGYVSKPLSLISSEAFDNYDDILVVRTFQSNYLDFTRFLQWRRNRLKKVAEFSRSGKQVVVYIKRKMEDTPLKTAERQEPD